MQRIAYDRTDVLPKLACSFEPLRQAVDVQVAHSYTYWSVSGSFLLLGVY